MKRIWITYLLVLVVFPLFAQDLKVLELELPKPQFIGTPTNFQVNELEIPTGPRGNFYVPGDVTNVALDKLIEASDEQPIMGDVELINDGNKEALEGTFVEFNSGAQQVTFDLEGVHVIYAIVIWHYHQTPRVYNDVIVQVSDDPDFILGVTTIFNNDINNSLGFGVGTDKHYVETFEGKLIDAKGIEGQYVRFYTNGNTDNYLNHYIEIEIYGKSLR